MGWGSSGSIGGVQRQGRRAEPGERPVGREKGEVQGQCAIYTCKQLGTVEAQLTDMLEARCSNMFAQLEIKLGATFTSERLGSSLCALAPRTSAPSTSAHGARPPSPIADGHVLKPAMHEHERAEAEHAEEVCPALPSLAPVSEGRPP